MSSDSENEVESEEEESTLYPLDGKYIDEVDKQRCEGPLTTARLALLTLHRAG
jgi:hypothetical protein